MALHQSLSVEFDIISKEIVDIVEDEVVALQNDLIDVGQAVWDTGEFKNSFAPLKKLSWASWVIRNDAEHSSILARGRRQVNGKWYGSLNWVDGLDPMIKKLNDNIERATNALR